MHTCTYACLYIHADRHASMHAWLYSRAAKESALVIFFFGPKMDPKLPNSSYKCKWTFISFIQLSLKKCVSPVVHLLAVPILPGYNV